MTASAAILLCILLWAMGLLPLAGAASAWSGRWSARGSAGLGQAGAVAACSVGLAAALAGLAFRATGGVTLPWRLPGGAFSVGLDPLSSFFLIPLFLLSGLAAVYAGAYFRPWQGRNPGRFWFFYNLLVAGMALVVLARNGVLFLLAWEAMSLASFFLVVHDDESAAAREAGWVYLVATHIGTAFLIALFILLGRAGGTQEFSGFAAPASAAGGLFLLALVGFGTKAGLFPLHIWLPEAHPAAPSPVSAVMSGVMVKTGIYGIVRMLTILGAVPAWSAWLVLGLGAASSVLGVLFALVQQDLKRVLAYSTVENIGIIVLGIGLGLLGLHYGSPAVAVLGFGGGLLHVLNHALFKGLLFLGAGAVAHAAGTRDIEQLGGLLKRMPWTGAAFLAGAAAICGLPPFNGFAGEFLIYLGSFKTLLGASGLALGGLVGVLTLALTGGLAAAGFTRVFGIAFQGEPRSPAAAAAHEAGPAMVVPLLLLAGLCLAIGLGAGWIVRGLGPAVAQLAGPAAVPALSQGVFPAALVVVLALGIFLVAGLAAIRRRLLKNRPVRESVTWDCGYAEPTARMQYTATGYAQPLLQGAPAGLRPQVDTQFPQGIFPAAAALHVQAPDVVRERLFAPLFRRAAILLGWFRWLQQGQVHFYVLYIVEALLVLQAWALKS